MAKRDARIEFRVPEETKVRWQEAADEFGWPSMSSMIVETVDAYVSGSAQPQAPEGAAGAPADRPEDPTEEGASLPAPAQLKVPGSDTRACPLERNHRKGTFCKGCKKVITK